MSGVLTGGYENFVIKDDRNIVHKYFSKARFAYDGEKMMRKYQFLQGQMRFQEIQNLQIDTHTNSISYLFIEGDTRWNLNVRNLEQVAEYLCQIHKIKFDKISEEFVAEQFFLEQDFFSEDSQMIEMWKHLKSNMIFKNEDFVHGDFHPGNIIWRGQKINGIIDWDNCHFGNKNLDIANFRFDLAVLYGIYYAERFLEFYVERSGEFIPDICRWDLGILCYQENRYLRWTKNIISKLSVSERKIQENYKTWKRYVKKQCMMITGELKEKIIDERSFM